MSKSFEFVFAQHKEHLIDVDMRFRLTARVATRTGPGSEALIAAFTNRVKTLLTAPVIELNPPGVINDLFIFGVNSWTQDRTRFSSIQNGTLYEFNVSFVDGLGDKVFSTRVCGAIASRLESFRISYENHQQASINSEAPGEPDFDPNNCQCSTCLDSSGKTMDFGGHEMPITFGRMVLCVICGNKRCPHAKNHRNLCTNSNDPGQSGSSYEHC